MSILHILSQKLDPVLSYITVMPLSLKREHHQNYPHVFTHQNEPLKTVRKNLNNV